MKTNPRFLLTASLVFAMAFAFSCSTDSDPEPTFYYSRYDLRDCSIFETITPNTNKNFEEIKSLWSEINKNGEFVASGADATEADLKKLLVERDVTPKEADEFIKRLKQRGNHIMAFEHLDNRYCAAVIYFEKN